MSIHPRRRLALALTLGVLVTLGATTQAGAAKSPSFLLDGGDRWFTHDSGYPVVLGAAEMHLGKRIVDGDLAANIHPDDYSMPAPGECEPAIAFVFVQPARGDETWLSSAGEVCGLYLQEPTNVVTHVFTGTATIEGSEVRRIEGSEAFLEIRLAVDGRASVFATTW